MDGLSLLVPLLTVPLGTFTGAVVARGRRLWPLWIAGFTMLGIVAGGLGAGIERNVFPPTVGYGLLAMWLAIDLTALAWALFREEAGAQARIRHLDEASANLLTGAIALGGGILATVAGFLLQQVVYPVSEDYETGGLLMVVVFILSFPLGTVVGMAIGRRITHTTK